MFPQEREATSSGLFKWTIDALFGKGISPSKKYRDANVSEEAVRMSPKRDTRRNLQTGVSSSPKRRSNSLDGFDPSFYRKYDLLSDDVREEPSAVLRSPIRLYPSDQLMTDTFMNKKRGTGRFPRSARRSASQSDADSDTAMLEKLFQGAAASRSVPTHDGHTRSVSIPGKFPFVHKDSGEFQELFRQLGENNSMLSQIQEQVRDINEENAQLRTDYAKIRIELIHELKESKTLMDKYTLLHKKYHDLKTVTNGMFEINTKLEKLTGDNKVALKKRDDWIDVLQERNRDLEAQLDQAIRTRENQLAQLNETWQDKLDELRDSYEWDRPRYRLHQPISDYI
ncbi:Bbp1p KNAG_0D00650 [Huiozyma naganishii CBS 8797]|uniref:Spindle pole component BBP1 n=1 Tax=Huiozyma naganishii (strain ATCC MYA-139 / BCRC 22969 / CBS 8797 / KCTC 17520 / NBRC 10181 / NCYC 3082 / Yp74L-3) TaxID=1071383 RepID=J7RXK2_HUIN7|nr:hypothetical protein KNAG_0D00650 [Kazachstania naganishii CBS 8797]CCK69817.1 hypothetical protein KNAG_0D00650 [Kazachstania naganishii CBS 8797]